MNNFFDRIYVVTCDDSENRQPYIRQHFKNFNISFEFKSAIDKSLLTSDIINPAQKSLILAHKHCILDSKLNNYNRILICEDDICFIENLHQHFNNFINILPSDWNFMQLGNQSIATSWLRRKYISENLYKFEWGTGSHCIGINSNVFDNIIETFKKMNDPVDFMYYDLFSKNNCYCPKNFLADALSKADVLSKNLNLKNDNTKPIFQSTIFYV